MKRNDPCGYLRGFQNIDMLYNGPSTFSISLHTDESISQCALDLHISSAHATHAKVCDTITLIR